MIPVARAAIQYNAGRHIVFDGNSLFTGTPNIPGMVMDGYPFAGSGVTYSATPIAGQTWRQMNGFDGGSSADVDAAFSSTRQNVLVCWEHTNAICNTGRTVEQCYADMVAYINARRAVKPDLRVLVVGTLPRQNYADVGTYTDVLAINVALQQIDELVADNRHSLDVGFVYLRGVGSPFAMSGFTEADFVATGDLWQEGTGNRVHVNNAGKAIIATMITQGLQTLAA